MKKELEKLHMNYTWASCAAGRLRVDEDTRRISEPFEIPYGPSNEYSGGSWPRTRTSRRGEEVS